MPPGLCGVCAFSRSIKDRAGKVYWLCEAHKTHAQMPKYPRLPVLSCPVFKPDELTRGNDDDTESEGMAD